nr:unnamed protein product [Callosobruchus analis]
MKISNASFFKTIRLKNYMNEYPEIISNDGTYCLVNLHLVIYIIMIKDGNGLSEIVAVCLVAEENKESLTFSLKPSRTKILPRKK